MGRRKMKPLQIIVLTKTGLATATLVAKNFSGAKVYAAEHIAPENFMPYKNFGELLKRLYKENLPIVALCASGILIRLLGPLLTDKFSEPPVLVLSPVGDVCVPLLGANNGANDIAREIAKVTNGVAAITTSGELQFGINLLNPPEDLELINKTSAKSFITKLLNGATVKLHGQHSWFASSFLPVCEDATLHIRIVDGAHDISDSPDSLFYRRRQIHNTLVKNDKEKGRLSIVGIGPGDEAHLTLAARQKLIEADEIYGYGYYIELVQHYIETQRLFPSDNRQETARAETAVQSALRGHKVVIVSSGDPGVFAMAAAVLEVLDQTPEMWNDIELDIEPGITAALAAAARIGAPIAHDFAVISLSDNLKPWSIIEKRLISALQADLVLALYNPRSKARPDKIKRCIELLHQHCERQRIIMVATDVFRENERVTICPLHELTCDLITSRSTLIVGSSQTRSFNLGARTFAYTPRHYFETHPDTTKHH